MRYVTEMARRSAALVALQPALDENCRRVSADTYPWPSQARHPASQSSQGTLVIA